MTAAHLDQGPAPAEQIDNDYSDTTGLATFRLVHNGFGFEWSTNCSIADLPEIILELMAHDMKGANTPLLWDEDKPEAHRPVSTPPQQPQQHSGQPQQPQGRPTGWDWNGNNTYAEQPQTTTPPAQPGNIPAPRKYDPQDSTPYCPFHDQKMAPSKFGPGWYCTGRGGPHPNDKGYCSYSFSQEKGPYAKT